MTQVLATLPIGAERDVVAARQLGRDIARALGFDAQDQTRVATAVSEIARNAQRYAHGGRCEFTLEGRHAPQILIIRITDEGPGIPHLDVVLGGRYRSRTGMGLGLSGAQRLVDQCDIATGPQGTTVALKKILPPAAPPLSVDPVEVLPEGPPGPGPAPGPVCWPACL
jgi:anti-sigma regulatory factor (Ser/Thr protein kinase)